MHLSSISGAVLFVALSSVQAEEPRKDKAAMQGTWLATSAELAGKPLPDEVRKSISLLIEDEKYTVMVGKNPDRGTIKLDPVAKPKAMDITGADGPNKGKNIPAIYEIDGDKLKICYDLSGSARPEEFKSTEGSQLFLVTYKREKK